MIKNDKVYLEHILEAISKIENYTNNITKIDFEKNVMIQDAVIRNIEIIGKQQRKFQNL